MSGQRGAIVTGGSRGIRGAIVLQLARDGGAFTIRYHAQSYPVAPPSLHDLVRAAAQRSASDALAFVADALGRLPAATERHILARVR